MSSIAIKRNSKKKLERLEIQFLEIFCFLCFYNDMKTSEDLILEVIEDVISEEIKYQPPLNHIKIDDYKSVLKSLDSFSPLNDRKWELTKGSNRPLNNKYIHDNMKKYVKMKHDLEHEKLSKKFSDFESRFTLEKMINHTNQIICLLEKCQKI